MTTIRSASERTSSNSSETSRIAAAGVALGDQPAVDELDRTRRRGRASAARRSRTRGSHAISRAMTHFCWLPPDSDVASDAGPPPRTSYSLMQVRWRASRMRPSRSMPCRDILGVLYSRSARFSARVKFSTRPRRWRSSAMWRDAVAHHPARAGVREVLAVDGDRAGVDRAQAGDGVDQLGLAVAVDAGQGHDLARVDGQRGAVDRRQVAVVADVQVADLEHRLLGLRRAACRRAAAPRGRP